MFVRLAVITALTLALFFLIFGQTTVKINEDKPVFEKPNDWFFRQRAFPYQEINYEKYQAALSQTKLLRKQNLLSAASWALAGPTNVGGRITDIEMSPTNFDTIYTGSASGGVFRSVDRGQSWTAIFENTRSFSIGDIAIDPTNSNIIYVGTGEVNGGGGSLTYGGNGVFRSDDSGESWRHLGLEQTRFIGRVVIDNLQPERLYVAAMGNLFSTNSERGVFRSTNGGATWQQALFLTDSTGCVDIVINPESTNILYAAMWERVRQPHRRSYGGASSGIYYSENHGESWQELVTGLPVSANVGRIGLAISASDPQTLYAVYADRIGYFAGVYKSVDGGISWSRTSETGISASYFYSSYGWWFGNIRVAPNDPDVVFIMGLPIYKSINGGAGWTQSFTGIHVDQHGLFIHPQDNQFIVAGNDGGVYTSTNGGNSWSKSPNIPITQFYTCEIDEQFPERLYGGTQDNGTNRTITGGMNDWQHILGGDGFYVLVDPLDNRFVYAESQYGNLQRSTNGGSKYSFSYAMSGVHGSDPNWNMPVVFNPLNPRSLYLGTNRIYKSTNRAQSWHPISDVLAYSPSDANLVFGTITAIAVAASDTSKIYAGTDDGNVWLGSDNGASWANISGSLPKRWVTRIAVDAGNAQIAYVTISGYRYASFLPHIFRTADFGTTWQDISGNLPEIPLNDIIIDPERDSTLYVASDVGVFATKNLGQNWQPLAKGLPVVPVLDLDLHTATNTLIAATYGRSMYKLNLGEITDVAPGKQTNSPESFTLEQNYPNPFNNETVIRYKMEKSSKVQIRIFDVTGSLVRNLVDGIEPAGQHQTIWDGKDARGNVVASGIYIYRLISAGQALAKQMVLVK